jgi:hypothetical protein
MSATGIVALGRNDISYMAGRYHETEDSPPVAIRSRQLGSFTGNPKSPFA